MALFIGFVLAQDKGLNYYQNQEYEAARSYYEMVLQKKGNHPTAQFGRGSAAYQQGDLETAKQSFEQTLNSDDTNLKSKAFYNLGNTFYQNQKMEDALAFYRKALELNPEDKDAKFNYEFLKYQQKPPEDQQDNKEHDQEKNELSDYAKEIKAQADKAVQNRRYSKALILMNELIQVDETAGENYSDFIRRLNDVTQINSQ